MSLWANTIGVDARVTPLDPPGGAEVGATVQRVPAIAFAKSARFAAPVAGDAYGDDPMLGEERPWRVRDVRFRQRFSRRAGACLATHPIVRHQAMHRRESHSLGYCFIGAIRKA